MVAGQPVEGDGVQGAVAALERQSPAPRRPAGCRWWSRTGVVAGRLRDRVGTRRPDDFERSDRRFEQIEDRPGGQAASGQVAFWSWGAMVRRASRTWPIVARRRGSRARPAARICASGASCRSDRSAFGPRGSRCGPGARRSARAACRRRTAAGPSASRRPGSRRRRRRRRWGRSKSGRRPRPTPRGRRSRGWRSRAAPCGRPGRSPPARAPGPPSRAPQARAAARLALAQDDVARLDVEVADPALVHDVQPAGDAVEDLQREGDRQLALVDHPLERWAPHQLHHEDRLGPGPGVEGHEAGQVRCAGARSAARPPPPGTSA